MKTVWVSVLLSLLSIGAFSGFSIALTGSVQHLFEMPASPSIAATVPDPDTPVGAIALDTPSRRPVPGSARSDIPLATKLSTYVLLHKTWHDDLPAPTKAGLAVCSE